MTLNAMTNTITSQSIIQIPKTWQLLLVVASFAAVEAVVSLPLLILALFNDDIAFNVSYDTPPTINVRSTDT